MDPNEKQLHLKSMSGGEMGAGGIVNVERTAPPELDSGSRSLLFSIWVAGSVSFNLLHPLSLLDMIVFVIPISCWIPVRTKSDNNARGSAVHDNHDIIITTGIISPSEKVEEVRCRGFLYLGIETRETQVFFCFALQHDESEGKYQYCSS